LVPDDDIILFIIVATDGDPNGSARPALVLAPFVGALEGSADDSLTLTDDIGFSFSGFEGPVKAVALEFRADSVLEPWLDGRL
jgi:hypothetical protein